MRALVLGLVIACSACSTGQLRAHITTAATTRASLDLGATVGEAACSVERARAMGEAQVPPEEFAAHERRCTRALGAHKAAVAAWVGYVTAVLAATGQRRPSLTQVLSWAAQVATLYGELRSAFQDLGIVLPALGGVE